MPSQACPEGGTYTVTPTQLSFAFTPASQTFANVTSNLEAAFFLAEVGTFTRYFAEGATSDFFETEIALLDATGKDTTASLTFLKGDGSTVTHDVPLAGLARATVYPGQLTGLANAEFSTVVTSTQPLIADRTMRWDARGYGSHAETSIAAPALKWYLAEGATLGGFNLFYLIQNPNPDAAAVEVTYLLPAPQAPLVSNYTITPITRFNIWVDLEDPQLASTAVSTRVRSTNAVPIIVERAMWWPGDASTWHEGHNSGGADRTSTKWGLADGQVGGPFNVETYIPDRQHRVHWRHGAGDPGLRRRDDSGSADSPAAQQSRERTRQHLLPRGGRSAFWRRGREFRVARPGDRRGAGDVR